MLPIIELITYHLFWLLLEKNHRTIILSKLQIFSMYSIFLKSFLCNILNAYKREYNFSNELKIVLSVPREKQLNN